LESFLKSKEKLVPRIETCQHSLTKTYGAKSRGEPSTIGMADLEPIRWATRSMPVEWQTDRFIGTAPC